MAQKREENIGELLKNVLPQDLIQFGLIPEFIGRVPIVESLNALDRDAMIRILTEPKNALCKQYEALMDMDGVKLTFEEDAIREIANQAITRKCGARGLRAIIEDAMLDTMFDLPGQTEINECVITKDAVTGGKPKLIAGVRNRRNAKRADSRQQSEDAKEIS
jgi:ATP-dependent Clp protease ATP-binding subunit ClpX